MNPAQKMITASAVPAADTTPIATEPAEPELTLDQDEDTSMVESLRLHLVSEHGIANALHLSDEDAALVHMRLHEVSDMHPVGDHRFRPGRILKALALAAQLHEEIQRLVAPLVPVQTMRT